MFSAGVYYIECAPTGSFYIGSSITSVRRRFNQHRHDLRSGRSGAPRLQRAWDKHGEEAFIFAPLLLCRPDEARDFEQLAIDLLKPDFNTLQAVGADNRPVTPEQLRQRASDRARAAWAAGVFTRNGQTIRQQHLVRGELLSAAEIADRYGFSVRTIRGRLRSGRQGESIIAPLLYSRGVTA